MNDASVPQVLFVDDDEAVSQRQLQAALQPHGVEVRLRTPEETLRGDVDWAHLIVVDYFLSHWPERDDVLSVARAPLNGLAVIASIRSALLPPLTERVTEEATPPPVAFALWSGNLQQATMGLPEVILPHVFSRENNLEWAFRRDDLLTEHGGLQLSLLAHAVRRLPDRWPARQSDAEADMLGMLGLATSGDDLEQSWMADARSEVLECRPPIHELSSRSHGLALLRWLLHRIFPYPTFLLDDLQLRARLRVDDLSGGETPEGESLLEALAPYAYNGILSEFLGRRWWRAGIEDWLFRVTNGDSGSSVAVATAAMTRGASARHAWRRPVVVLSPALARLPEFAEIEQCVRVRPDDWPVFADDAYARVVDVENEPSLRELVDPADRGRIRSVTAKGTEG